MSIDSIEAVLPVRLSGEKERLTGERFVMLLDSLSVHWIDPTPFRITVVGMGPELPALRQLAGRRPNLDLHFLDERELIGDWRIQNLIGWYKQMYIKLLFARVCAADAYIYLDADVLCIRPLSASHMVRDGRAIADWESKDVHPGWWAASRAVLGHPNPKSNRGLSVTPNVLTRDLARAVPAAVALANGGDAIGALVARSLVWDQCWVENAVYTELGQITGELEQVLAPDDGRRRYHSEADLWSPAQLEGWSPLERLACEPLVRFLVVQSTAGLEPAHLRQLLAPLLSPAGQERDELGAPYDAAPAVRP